MFGPQQKGLLSLMVIFRLPVVYHCVELKIFLYSVLSSKKGETRPNKGRDYEIFKLEWEEEIRKSLATKKRQQSP